MSVLKLFQKKREEKFVSVKPGEPGIMWGVAQSEGRYTRVEPPSGMLYYMDYVYSDDVPETEKVFPVLQKTDPVHELLDSFNALSGITADLYKRVEVIEKDRAIEDANEYTAQENRRWHQENIERRLFELEEKVNDIQRRLSQQVVTLPSGETVTLYPV